MSSKAELLGIEGVTVDRMRRLAGADGRRDWALDTARSRGVDILFILGARARVVPQASSQTKTQCKVTVTWRTRTWTLCWTGLSIPDYKPHVLNFRASRVLSLLCGSV